jgi:hypothetical protein
VHWKLPEPNSNDTAAEGKAKEPKKAKGEEAKSSRSITLGTEADPIKRPQERKKEKEKERGK